MKPTHIRERIADGIVHVIGVSAGLIAVVAMLVAAVRSLPASSIACLGIYGAGMLAMLGFSAAYHTVPVPSWKVVLRRLDHAAIFLKIAGTYTPFTIVKIGGIAGYTFTNSVWAVALFGVVGKLVLASTWDRVAIALYLVLGWTGVIMLEPLAASVEPSTLILLGVGGVLYSAGVIFHVWRTLPYQNAVWHLFVLAGTGCHFCAVTTAIFT